MTCKDCKNFMKFDSKGIEEVLGDGMCTKAGRDKVKEWRPVVFSHQCPDFDSNAEPASKMLSIPEMRKQTEPEGQCRDCASWRRQGFTGSGQCWTGDSGNVNKGLLKRDDASACHFFHPRPNSNAQAGDIVEISIGEQWQLKFVGVTHIIVIDRQGNEKAFDKKGLRFRKC